MSKFPKEPGKVAQVMVLLAAFVIVVAGMKAAEAIIVPFILSAFIAIIASPPYFWFQSKGIPKFISLLLVILVFLFFVLLVGYLIGASVNDFTSKLDFYEEKLSTQIDALSSWLISTGINKEEINVKNLINPGAVFQVLSNALNEISGLFANGFLILLTVIFMLLEVASLPVKLKKISSDPDKSITRLQSITSNINKYIGIKTAISLITGMLVTVFLTILGVDYAILWGVLAFVLNYIPTIGSIIALIPAVLLTLVQLGFVEALIALAGYIIINTIMGNILEPKFMGKGLGLSTLVVFVSILFWGWVFGPIGMLLSVPLTITIKIILDYSDETKWISILLGPETIE